MPLSRPLLLLPSIREICDPVPAVHTTSLSRKRLSFCRVSFVADRGLGDTNPNSFDCLTLQRTPRATNCRLRHGVACCVFGDRRRKLVAPGTLPMVANVDGATERQNRSGWRIGDGECAASRPPPRRTRATLSDGIWTDVHDGDRRGHFLEGSREVFWPRRGARNREKERRGRAA